MAAVLSATTMKRLAFIHSLHQQGHEQAQRPEPLSAMSILAYHDAVELFLVLAGEQLQARLNPKINFLEYWKELAKADQPTPTTLTGQRTMDRLNRLRVDLKHHGSIPGHTAIEQATADVNTFFTDNAPLVFGIDYDDVDMIGLVTQEFARDYLKQADDHAARGEITQAMAYLSEAFDALLDDYDKRKRINYRQSAFSFGSDYRFTTRSMLNKIRREDRDMGEFLEKTQDSVVRLQQAVRVMSVGLDYRSYARFAMITPNILRGVNERGETGLQIIAVPGLQLTQQDYDFARSFVVTTSLRLAEVDFDLDLEELYRQDRERERQRAEPPTS